jgi:hypothetical protein
MRSLPACDRWIVAALAACLIAVVLILSPRPDAAAQIHPAFQTGSKAADRAPPNGEELAAKCAAAAKELRPRLGDECHLLVHSPFVIAGNLSEADLAAWHRRTIEPAAKAIANCYTKAAPSEPITILLLADEKSYRGYAEKLFGDRSVSVYGYYKPSLRTMVMNISTGGGTLVHELTHALVDFDFPEIPDWFNEGLASLHEQCEFRWDESSIDGPFIKGLVNWRLPALQKAIAEGRLRPLEELIGGDDFRARLEGLNYAQARYFCLYLQEQGVLRKFYVAFRDGRRTDRLGLKTAKAVFPEQSWDELNQAFRRWAAGLER